MKNCQNWTDLQELFLWKEGRVDPITLVEATTICRRWGFGSLLTTPKDNAKLAKSEGHWNCGISFLPGDASGHEVCPARGSCFKYDGENVCLAFKGQAEHLRSVNSFRKARTVFRAAVIEEFNNVLVAEMFKEDRAAKRLGLPVAFRPNIFSDLPWHRTHNWLFDAFNHWQFYGYTKVKGYIRDYIAGKLPENYHLTFSLSERATIAEAVSVLNHGINVAIVFNCTDPVDLPSRWFGFDVIDGNKSDLRFQDPKGVVVGLTLKTPKAKNDADRFRKRIAKSGFVVSCLTMRFINPVTEQIAK